MGKSAEQIFLERAAECGAKAAAAATQEGKQFFADLAATWLRLADLEAKADAIISRTPDYSGLLYGEKKATPERGQ